MPYKCNVCGANDVDNKGDICEMCAISQDPYAVNPSISSGAVNKDNCVNSYLPKRGNNRKVLLNGGAAMVNCDPYGNDMTDSPPQPPVQVYSAGQTPQVSKAVNPISSTVSQITAKQALSTGIAKNISVDNQKKSILSKWVRALFAGIPFTFDNEVTMFQVFPDFTGTSLNAMSNSCDQVIFYGKINAGAICENNDVEVFGHRDSNNNIIAKTIRNKASGTTIKPMRTIGTGIVWLITMLLLSLIVVAAMGLGVEGIIWAVVIILCLTNLPTVLKIIGVVFCAIFSFIKRLF